MHFFAIKIFSLFIFVKYLIPNTAFNDNVRAVEYTFEGNLSVKNFNQLKLFNGENMIFNDGIFDEIKILSQGLLVNNTKDGDWMYYNKDGLVEQLVSYNKGKKLKVLFVDK